MSSVRKSLRNRKSLHRQRRSGFTLLELLLVMAILVILASLATVAVLNIQSGSQDKAAYTQIKILKNACTMYKLNVSAYPKTLENLIVQPPGMSTAIWGGPWLDVKTIPLDPWQNPYKFSANDSTNQVLISSAGKDGQHGTQDDIPGAAG